MDLVEVVRVLVRYWRTSLPLLVLFLAGTYAAFLLLPAPSQVQASVLLYNAPDSQAGGNPFQSFTNSLAITADAVAQAQTAPDRVLAIQQQVRGATHFTVVLDPRGTGPFLQVTATGRPASSAQATLNAVLEDIPRTLAHLQAEASGVQNVIKTTVVVVGAPTTLAKIRVTHTAPVALLLGVLAIGVPLLQQRRDRRRGDAEPEPNVAPSDVEGALAPEWTEVAPHRTTGDSRPAPGDQRRTVVR